MIGMAKSLLGLQSVSHQMALASRASRLAKSLRYASEWPGGNNSEQIKEFNEDLEHIFGPVEDQLKHSTLSNDSSNASPDTIKQRSGGLLSHADRYGKAAMVDVGDKATTIRYATASGRVLLGAAAFKAVEDNTLAKGDVLSVARIAGIMAAKETARLIPLCHTLALDKIEVQFSMRPHLYAIDILGRARCSGRTGVEMEALMAVGISALTIYDMCKAVSKEIVIQNIQLESKDGGKSSDWSRTQAPQLSLQS